MAMKTIISTLADDNAYQVFGDSPRRVVVRGCAGVRRIGRGAQQGVCTEVSDSDAEFLANHGMFREHQARGHVRIENFASNSDNERPD
jgi:hypothetical protein